MVTLSARPRALAAGYGLGLGGAVLAMVLTIPAVLVLSSTVSILLVSFVLGQYLPFVGLPLVYFRSRGMNWAEIREYLGVRVPTLREVGVSVAGFLAVLLLASGAIVLVTQVLGLQPANNSAGETARRLPRLIPLFIAASFLVIAPCEETLFRGTVQGRLRESFSAPVAITLAALLFASIHLTALTGGLSGRAVTIAILLVPSFVFGAVYEYTDNLVVPVLTHGVWNAFIFLSLYVSIVLAPDSAYAVAFLSVLG